MKLAEEHHKFLREYIPDHTHLEIVEEFNKRYPEINFTYNQSRAYVKNHKIKTASDGRFKKGQDSWNKGKKMSKEFCEKSRATQFKKGNVPHNHVPVGTIAVTTDGYKKIKISEPNVWKLYSRYIWEENNGPIPKGCKIIHVNGDRLDDRIENLDIISSSDMARINSTKLFGKNEDINKCVINLSKLNSKIADKSK